MDYKRYKDLMERYHELNEFVPDQDEKKDDFLKKLMDISVEKKQIYNEANVIISEYLEKYEKNPCLLDGKAVETLYYSLGMLQVLDVSVSLRIARLLLTYCQTVQDLERTVQLLSICTIFDLLMKSHMDDFESSPYSLMAEQYLDDFDRLSDSGKAMLVDCWMQCVLNQKDRTFGMKKYREIRDRFAVFRRKMGEDFMLNRYIVCQSTVLDAAFYSCIRTEYAKKCGVTPAGPVIDLEKEASLMEEMRRELSAIFDREDIEKLNVSEVYTRLIIAQADYHLGKITVEELLTRLKELSQIHERYNTHEQCNALFMANTVYLEYLYKCSGFDRQYVLDEGRKIIEHVLGSMDKISRDLGPIVGTIHINHCIIDFISAASGIVEFGLFKSTVLNATVYADKALYVHTMMVKEICLTFLDYILENDPGYLDGVAGYDWEYCSDHKGEIMDLMENCALFHDIGKYFCIDIVSNSSRRLTDDEFEAIKYHPINFSAIYQGDMTPEIKCIRDCALLHHRWYNGEGGYPSEKHTANKPLVNILTVADCIDAATDNIGRPYGRGNTLENLMQEFDDAEDVRYSGYIGRLLHVEEIQRRINYVINDRRKEIYCDIYLRTQ